ncbi:MAG: hypothetical protein HS100_13095 [Anaerolineales bacterium]|nr:hypothetical protein [Anaerolineales bacterium]
MTIEQIGYRRLYDSLGCSLSTEDELNFNTKIGDLEVVVYMGAKPKRGIVVYSNIGKYIVPGEEYSPVMNVEYQKDATLSNYPRKFFTEIQCIKQVDVPQELSIAFHAGESGADDKMLKLGEKEIENFKETTDLIAGIIGLRFHRQFVLEAINENIFAVKRNDNWATQINGPAVEFLEEPKLNAIGVKTLPNLISELDKAPVEAREVGISIFGWLLRAWVERDVISKFTALFIPLEIILTGYGQENASDNARLKEYEKMRELISEHAKDDSEMLLKIFDSLVQSQRPSLVSRFEELANKAKLEGFENHIVAFKRFNRIRNKLFHHGDPKVKLEVPISGESLEQETQQLEDLVERYVSWSLFRDQVVYPSRWRKGHGR